MAKAVVARQLGDDFQARLFWLEAAKLLDPNSCVASVAFESGPKGFDDVVMRYDPSRPLQDGFGYPVYVDFLQVKWHVTAAGSIGYLDLIDPEFIGATSTSFLQNLHAAQRDHAPGGTGARFSLVTNWRYAPDDPLCRLFHKNSDALLPDVLFDGTTDRSVMGKVRKAWRQHLGLADDDGLGPTVRPLRICERPQSLEVQRDHLNARLMSVGLRSVDDARLANSYDDLIRKLHAQGRVTFDRADFAEMCRKEGLLLSDGPTPQGRPKGVLTIGIRSFIRFGENLEEQTDRMLDLVQYFDGRYVRNNTSWRTQILPELAQFLTAAVRDADRIQLQLDAHGSLAFAVGTFLNAKSGKTIELVQRGGRGIQIWTATDADPGAAPALTLASEARSSTGGDVAVAISLTHSVVRDVRAYVTDRLPDVSTLLVCEPEGGPSQLSVRNGAHAWAWTEQIVRTVRSLRTPRTRIHIFAACPNVMLLFLGQQQAALGPCIIYEWDFEGHRSRSYEPSLAFGEPAPAS